MVNYTEQILVKQLSMFRSAYAGGNNYVLMDNHYHIVVEMLATPVDEIMRRINRTYSGYYNLKYVSVQ